MPTENNIIISIISAAIGGFVTFLSIRIFTKSEDSASKMYVDKEIEKLDTKLSQKVDKQDYNIAIQRVESKIDKVLMILVEQKQSQK